MQLSILLAQPCSASSCYFWKWKGQKKKKGWGGGGHNVDIWALYACVKRERGSTLWADFYDSWGPTEHDLLSSFA